MNDSIFVKKQSNKDPRKKKCWNNSRKKISGKIMMLSISLASQREVMLRIFCALRKTRWKEGRFWKNVPNMMRGSARKYRDRRE